MNTRKDKINILKEKILDMKNQLSYLQSKDHSHQRSHSKSINRSPPCNIKNKEYKSPTFWNTNPITHENKYSTQKIIKKSPIFNKEVRQETKRTLSPKIKNISNTIDFNYYMKSTINLQEKPKVNTNIKIQKVQKSSYKQKYHQKSFDFERKSLQKQSKIKTYATKKTNPILNPQPYLRASIKIVKTVQPSPEKFLTDHPKSNTKAYCYGDKMTYLGKKQNISKKNVSSITLEHHESEDCSTDINLNRTLQKKRKSQRKHFAQYFNDIFVPHLE